MNCDCDECRRPTWREWLDGEPGPWSTLIVVVAVLTAVGVFMFGRG